MMTAAISYPDCLFMRHFEEKREKEPKRSQRNDKLLEILAENPVLTQIMLMSEFEKKTVAERDTGIAERGVFVKKGFNRSGRWIVKK